MFSLVEVKTKYMNIKTAPTKLHIEHVVLKLCVDDAHAALMEQNTQT